MQSHLQFVFFAANQSVNFTMKTNLFPVNASMINLSALIAAIFNICCSEQLRRREEKPGSETRRTLNVKPALLPKHQIFTWAETFITGL